jgi:hypothetical protein
MHRPIVVVARAVPVRARASSVHTSVRVCERATHTSVHACVAAVTSSGPQHQRLRQVHLACKKRPAVQQASCTINVQRATCNVQHHRPPDCNSQHKRCRAQHTLSASAWPGIVAQARASGWARPRTHRTKLGTRPSSEHAARMSAGGLRRKRAPAQFLSGAFVSTCTAIARF